MIGTRGGWLGGVGWGWGCGWGGMGGVAVTCLILFIPCSCMLMARAWCIGIGNFARSAPCCYSMPSCSWMAARVTPGRRPGVLPLLMRHSPLALSMQKMYDIDNRIYTPELKWRMQSTSYSQRNIVHSKKSLQQNQPKSIKTKHQIIDQQMGTDGQQKITRDRKSVV